MKTKIKRYEHYIKEIRQTGHYPPLPSPLTTGRWLPFSLNISAHGEFLVFVAWFSAVGWPMPFSCINKSWRRATNLLFLPYTGCPLMHSAWNKLVYGCFWTFVIFISPWGVFFGRGVGNHAVRHLRSAETFCIQKKLYC